MRKQTKSLTIKSLIHKEYRITFIYTIVFIETMLLLLYFGVNYYTSHNTKNIMINEAKENLSQISLVESKNINYRLRKISEMASFLQKEHQHFFENYNDTFYRPKNLSFKKSSHGVFYKDKDNGGSSLVYLNVKNVKIGQKEIEKAKKSEVLDLTFKNLYEINKNIVAIYLNTHDSMNRYYPYLKDLYSQYDPNMDIPKFNFYYEADLKHNPSKKPVWTDVYLDPAGKGWMASCIVPVYNKNFLEGVTGIDVTINTFIKSILSLNLPWKASAFLIDKNGTILAMPEETEKILGLKELKQHVYKNSVKADTYKPEEYNLFKSKNSVLANDLKEIYKTKNSLNEIKINGVDYILSQQVIDETGWRFLVLVSKDNIFKPVYELEHKNQKLGIISIIYIILLYVFLFYYILGKTKKISSTLSEPILSLSDKTGKILSGENIEISKCGIEEIDNMSLNFNVMTDTLRKLYEKLNSDIEHRAIIQSELEHAKKLAESANQAKSDFLANVSHELRTPITSIQGSIKLLSANLIDDPEEVNNLFKIASNNCSRLINLVNDILDLTKIEQSKLEFNFANVELLPLLEEAIENNISFAKQNNVSLEFINENIDKSLLVNVDKNRIMQVLSNLLSNAIKFSYPQEKVLLSVSLMDDKVKVSVIDHGQGIPKELQKNIFQRFYQVDSSSTKKTGGTGLGLNISKLIIEKMGGNIGFVIEDNTTFYFELPVLK